MDGHPKFYKHAKQQASTIISLCKSLRCLTDEDLGSLTRKIVDVGLPSDLEGEVISSITSQETVQTGRSNAPLQKYESIVGYFKPSQYKYMDGKSPVVILTSIIDHAIDLDLRNPSCPTFGMLAAFYKCLAIGMDNVLELSKMDKYNDVMFVKKCFISVRSLQSRRCQSSIFCQSHRQLSLKVIRRRPAFSTTRCLRRALSILAPFSLLRIRSRCEGQRPWCRVLPCSVFPAAIHVRIYGR